VRAFTFGFDDGVLDEADAAAETARWVGAEHHVLRVSRADVARDVPAAVHSMDLPTSDGVNTWVISRAIAAEGYKVVLSGLGGDEIFGGYPSFRLLPRLHRWRAVLGRIPRLARRLAGGGGGRGGRLVAMTDRRSSLSARYEQLRALWSDDELADLGVRAPAPLTGVGLAPDLSNTAAVSLLELSGYMRSTLLRDSDVMSMSHSLELRVPLLDHDLVTACLRAGVAADRPPKAALLAAAGAAIPPGVGRRPKRGFMLPMDAWMRGPLAAFTDSGLDEVSRRLPGATVAHLRARFRAGSLPWARLWSLAVLGHWLARHRPS
jgi:asparagine synthase (glutamine-hydrolysing)